MIQINLQILNGRDRTLHFLLYHHYYYFLSLSRSFLVLSVKFEEINWRWLPVYYTSCPSGWPWITFTGSHLVLPLYCFHLKCKSNSPHGTAAQPFSARVCCNFFCYLHLRLANNALFKKNSSTLLLSGLENSDQPVLPVFFPSQLKRRYL